MAEQAPAPIGWRKFSPWLFGIVVLLGLISIVVHFGELQQFLNLVRNAEPAWLVLVLLFQVTTYFSLAGVWYLALRRTQFRQSLLALVPIGVAKLFSDQVLPSAGVSGTAFFIAALKRRGVPPSMCMAILLMSLVGYYGSYLIAASVSVMLLWRHHAIQAWIVAVAVLFCVVAVGIPAGALWLRSLGERRLPVSLRRIPGLSRFMSTIAHAPDHLLRNPGLVGASAVLQGLIFALDAATLWVLLKMVGVHVSYWLAFPSFLLASMVATIGIVPLGLGTFEATCVGILGLLGVPIEAGLAATLLLRGFTLWLPMVPGIWLSSTVLAGSGRSAASP